MLGPSYWAAQLAKKKDVKVALAMLPLSIVSINVIL